MIRQVSCGLSPCLGDEKGDGSKESSCNQLAKDTLAKVIVVVVKRKWKSSLLFDCGTVKHEFSVIRLGFPFPEVKRFSPVSLINTTVSERRFEMDSMDHSHYLQQKWIKWIGQESQMATTVVLTNDYGCRNVPTLCNTDTKVCPK